MWWGERKYAWGLLALLWTFGCIGALSRFVMAYYQTAITGDFGVGRSFVSLSWSLNLLVTALCTPLGGWLVDRYGPKRVMAAATLCGSLGSGLIFLSHHPTAFVIGYGILSGLVGIGMTTTYNLTFHWFRRHRAKAVMIVGSASPLGLALASPVFYHYETLTWEYAFLLTALLGIALVIPATLLFVRNPSAEAPGPETDLSTPGQPEASAPAEPKASPEAVPAPGWRQRWAAAIRGGLRSPALLVIGAALFTCGFHMGTVEMNMVAIHQHAHVPAATVASAVSLLGLMEVIGSFAFGYVLDRYPRAIVLSALYLLRGAGFTLLLLHMDLSPFWFSVLFGATYLGAIPGALLLAKETLGDSSAQTGVLLLFHQAGGIVGALTSGFLFDAFGSYQPLIGLSLTLAVAVALGYAWVYAYARKRRQSAAAGAAV